MNEQFEKLWALRPHGNLINAKSEYDYAVASKKVTPETLYQKYEEYLIFCRHTERKDQFIKGLTNFIRDGDYTGEWKVPGIQQAIDKLTKNEPIDPPRTGNPKPFGAHLQRPIVRPNGKDGPAGNGNDQGEGPAGIRIDDQ